MKLPIVITALWVFFSGCTRPSPSEIAPASYDVKGKEVKIYTTADSSALRLTPTGTKSFQAAKQPLETEVAIFVNPAKTFQSFMGIGGAVTDATAEVFATLPPEKQQAF